MSFVPDKTSDRHSYWCREWRARIN